MTFGNPVPGIIHPENWAGALGPTSWKIANGGSFADHVASGRAPGVDFSNRRCGDPVLAAEAGTVASIFTDPNGAKVVRIKHPQLGIISTGYAHLATIGVTRGQIVKRGQLIGTVGNTGAQFCHLHWGVNDGGREVDGWPLLDQNQEDDMTTIVDAVKYLGADGKPAPRTVTFDAGTYIAYRLDGTKKPGTVGAGSTAPADALCTISHVPDADPHGPNWLRITAGLWAGCFMQLRPGITVAPDPPLLSQDDLDKAKLAGAAANEVKWTTWVAQHP